MGLDRVLQNVQSYAQSAGAAATGASHQRVIEGGAGGNAREHTRALNGTTDALVDLKQSLDQSAVGKRVSRPPPLPGKKEGAAVAVAEKVRPKTMLETLKETMEKVLKPLGKIGKWLLAATGAMFAMAKLSGPLLKSQERSRGFDAPSAIGYARLDRAKLIDEVYMARASQTSRMHLIEAEMKAMALTRGARSRMVDMTNILAAESRKASAHSINALDKTLQGMQDIMKKFGIDWGLGGPGGATRSPFDEFTKEMREPKNIPPQIL